MDRVFTLFLTASRQMAERRAMHHHGLLRETHKNSIPINPDRVAFQGPGGRIF
ncbi:MAG: hypothetical protein MZV70_30505 [Desulfobacterales bacterium]|nr:hypothetical protein [Desulfobacterales bacterium]